MSLNKQSPTPADLVAVKAAREVALLRRWMAGEVLPTSEMAELVHVLPASVLANPPAPENSKSIDDYAREIGASRRTIFRWQQIGRDAKDWCPLDKPSRMLDWWGRNMGKRPPAYLIAWVERPREAVTVPPAAPSGGASAPDAALPSLAKPGQPPLPREAQSINLSALGGFGLDSAVAILRQTVEARSLALATAYLSTDDSAQQRAQAKFDEAVEELRKAEKALLDIQKARGDLAPKSEFTADLVTLATALRGMHARMPDNVVAELRKSGVVFTEEQLAAIRTAIASTRAVEQHLLRNARHWRAHVDGEVTPALAPAAA